MNPNNVISVEKLSYRYNKKGELAVNDVSFNISKGEIFGFLGPSGAGKSTVQKILTGILPVQEGSVLFNGNSIEKSKTKFYNKIGVSFEQPNFYAKLSGYENLKFYSRLFSVPTLDAGNLLHSVGLGDAAHKKAETYSKGMQQRLVFARSLINNPDILFLDEPLSGLDPGIANSIKEIIKEKKQQGTTIFLTTHNMFIADELCDRVAFINSGEIITIDTPKNLKLEHGKKSIKIEYIDNNEIQTKILSLENPQEQEQFNVLVQQKEIVTIHSQEASLEQIFIKLTGRRLS